MDLISVIIPVYNTELYLQRCVNSVCTQTYQNLEIILIDDGSEDSCPQICEELSRGDGRILVFHQRNSGQGMARNVGLRNAKGRYVIFLDSDDWISKDHIENMYREIISTEADVVLGTYTSVTMDGRQCRHPWKLQPLAYTGAEIRLLLIPELLGTPTSAVSDVGIESSACMNLYRMALIRDYNLEFISERMAVAEDLFFNLDFLSYADKVAVLDEAGYFYYTNIQSTSHKYNSMRFARTCCFYQLLKQRVASLNIAAEQRIQRTFLMKIRVNIQLIVGSDMNFCQKRKEIKEILQHQLVREVLNNYPLQTYPVKHMIMALMMKWRWAMGVYCLVLLRNAISAC